jgi:hypothetical protein
MLTLPITNTEKTKEWNIIQNIAQNNGIPPDKIYKLRQQIENKLQAPIQSQILPKAWITFTFNNPAVHKITYLFQNTGLKIAYKPTNTICNFLKPRLNFNPLRQSGIYQLRCVTCDRVYVGQSGREVRTRYNEHIRYIRNNNPESAYAQHILNTGHEIGPSSQTLQLLKHCHKGKIMNCWETFHIQRLHHETGLIPEQSSQELNPLYTISHNLTSVT